MAQMMLVNPRKRRRKSTKRKTSRRSTPSKRLATVTTRKTYRRNPIRKGAGVVDTFTKGAVGAAGALAVDVAMQKLPIPANLQTGVMAPAVKGLVGIGLGMLVSRVGRNKKLGAQLADGAVTVALYGTGKNMLAPTLGLSDDLLGMDDSLLYYGEDDDGMSYYDEDDGMGYTNAASVFDFDEDDH